MNQPNQFQPDTAHNQDKKVSRFVKQLMKFLDTSKGDLFYD